MFHSSLPNIHHALRCLIRRALGAVCFLIALFHVGSAQSDLSPESMKAEALAAFEEENWELAHRRFAELLSLDGTNKQLQVKYAATLLHDARSREEGIQRLASLAHDGDLDDEGWYWWGRALMLQGEGVDAEAALNRALDLAPKKAIWREACELALRQSRALPVRFEKRQGLKRLDVVDVPRLSFHRYIQWQREGVRVMLVPEDLQTKLDLKRNVVAPVTFWRGSREVFYHSLGSKGETGLDLWVGTLDMDGEFSEAQRLPDWVNSLEDDVHPVWEPASQCLYFASNRPGTVGGMDVWRACREEGKWGRAESLGPLYNSVHDEWAFYPADTVTSGWLLTGREAAYGGTEVWEVVPDGPPSAPVLLTTNWEVEGDVVPGTLTLTDAQSDLVLAKVNLEEPSGTWDLVVASGQVIRYSFLTSTGDVIEGTYALPEVESPSSVEQRMIMTMLDGKPFLDARPLSRASAPNHKLTWGWNLVTDEVVVPDVKPLVVSEREEVEEPVVQNKPRPIRQFQSYPWWTEIQKEERELAANVLSSFAPNWVFSSVRASEFSAVEDYEARLSERGNEIVSDAVDAVMSLAASDVLRNETPWEEALNVALNRANTVWPVGTINVEEVARKAKRRWAQSGSLYDKGLLPEVRDKEGLVGDGAWVELPWQRGDVAALAAKRTEYTAPRTEAARVVWALAHQPDTSEDWGEMWYVPGMWNLHAVTANIQDWLAQVSSGNGETSETSPTEKQRMAAMRKTLSEIRTRLSMLDSMEPTAGWTEEMRADELRQWTALALTLSEALNQDSEAVESKEILEEEASSAPKGEDVDSVSPSTHASQAEEALQAEWIAVWEEWKRAMTKEFPDVDASLSRSKGDQGSTDWFREFTTWLPDDYKESWQPQDLVERAVNCWTLPVEDEAKQTDDEEWKAQKGWPLSSEVEGAKRRLTEQLQRQAGPGLEEDEARDLVLSSWLIAKWRFDPSWVSRSPEEMLAITTSWHPLAQEELKAIGVQWAKFQQSQAPLAVQEYPSEGGGDPDQTQVRPKEPLAEVGARTLTRGAQGVHLGWFRKQPTLGTLPQGTRLDSQEGSQGLMRWVLVLPQDEVGTDWEAVQRWLAQTGVTDAHEVHWHGDAWKKEPVPTVVVEASDSAEEGGAVGDVDPATDQNATPDANPNTDSNSNLDANSESDSASDGLEDANLSGNPTNQGKPIEAQWGGDELWEHGAPVELGNLMGTWYAVQVGAFRGAPQKEWIEQAGERLVYEPFPDGLARWYAGVRQDHASAKARWEELRQFAPFADAFVVRLRNGQREVIRPGDNPDDASVIELADGTLQGDVATSAKNNAEEAPGEDVPDESGKGGDGIRNEANASSVQSDVNVRQPAEAMPSAEVGASLALPSRGVAAAWHIDISRYYGTVPSRDVAALLFKAADWGVRSVELFGQTTYFSRTFTDLGEAERVLAEVKREGFVNAKLVKEE